jgi:hypothetical protein
VLLLIKNSLVKIKFETVHFRDSTASSFVVKVQGEVFALFHAVAAKVTVARRIGGLTSQGEFFVNNPLDVKENNEHAPDFAIQLFRIFWSALNRACYPNTVSGSCFLPRTLI